MQAAPTAACDVSAPDKHGLPGSSSAPTFERAILPHLDAAYNFACWLTRDSVVAEDVVQDACLRALKYFSSFRGANALAWLLQIVRHAAYAKFPRADVDSAGDADREIEDSDFDIANSDSGPEASLAVDQVRCQIRAAIAALPIHLRECLLLREMEELSYQKIAQIVGVPTGTVMSRLFRARRMLMTHPLARLTS